MHSKSLIILFVFLITLCLATFCFATDASNSVKNVSNTMVDGVEELGSDVKKGIESVENGIEGALSMNTMDNRDNMLTAQSATSTMNDDTYYASRVATAGTTNTNTMWVWIALVIAAVVIVGLVWYYGTQDNI